MMNSVDVTVRLGAISLRTYVFFLRYALQCVRMLARYVINCYANVTPKFIPYSLSISMEIRQRDAKRTVRATRRMSSGSDIYPLIDMRIQRLVVVEGQVSWHRIHLWICKLHLHDHVARTAMWVNKGKQTPLTYAWTLQILG